MDGLGELAGAPRAAAELPQDPSGLERVHAFTGRAESRVSAVGFFPGFGLVLASLTMGFFSLSGDAPPGDHPVTDGPDQAGSG
jgi:hypothetical protein